uniref:Peptidase A1 domain-containing protein n=2 Tax=Bursaphelenchus xylophilus TaxID=6326 RepID=A0A1I7SHW4_BURXY
MNGDFLIALYSTDTMAFIGRCRQARQCSAQGHKIYDYKRNTRYPGKDFMDNLTGHQYRGKLFSDKIKLAGVEFKQVFFGGVEGPPEHTDPSDIDFPYDGFVGIGLGQKRAFMRSFLYQSPAGRRNIIIVQDAYKKPVFNDNVRIEQKQSGKTYLHSDIRPSSTDKVPECGIFAQSVVLTKPKGGMEWLIKSDITIGNDTFNSYIKFNPSGPTKLHYLRITQYLGKTKFKNSEARNLPRIHFRLDKQDFILDASDYIVKDNSTRVRHLTIKAGEDITYPLELGYEFFQKYCLQLSYDSSSSAFKIGLAPNVVNKFVSDIDPGDDDYEDEPEDDYGHTTDKSEEDDNDKGDDIVDGESITPRTSVVYTLVAIQLIWLF